MIKKRDELKRCRARNLLRESGAPPKIHGERSEEKEKGVGSERNDKTPRGRERRGGWLAARETSVQILTRGRKKG